MHVLFKQFSSVDLFDVTETTLYTSTWLFYWMKWLCLLEYKTVGVGGGGGVGGGSGSLLLHCVTLRIPFQYKDSSYETWNGAAHHVWVVIWMRKVFHVLSIFSAQINCLIRFYIKIRQFGYFFFLLLFFFFFLFYFMCYMCDVWLVAVLICRPGNAGCIPGKRSRTRRSLDLFCRTREMVVLWPIRLALAIS